MLAGRHIVVGVTGGIAAYKCAVLVRELVKVGAEVQVVMTRAATQFITPLTFGTLSRRDVIVEMFSGSGGESTPQWTRHIELGVWADVMVIAPASANTVAKITCGFADNFLTTLVLALRCPLILAPSMDVDMWRNSTTQNNVRILKERGYHVLEPETGELASGLSGAGRMPEPETILRFVDSVLTGAHRDLTGKTILVTAGPTQEPIDPVRYIGNRSSGKMGFALAAAAAARGATVTLVAGPVDRETPRGVRRIDVMTAREMNEAVQREFPAADAVVMAAAVADFAPTSPSASKIKRGSLAKGSMTINLTQNPDILKSLGERKTRQILVGFALETEDGPANALQKLTSKNIDLIVLNNPHVEGAGFGSDTNVVTVLGRDGATENLPRMAKVDLAHVILDRVVRLMS
jgi:phosphopantothenoylcysteine decarboxylase/phosphopantothenate--cysteine ligase